jgi:anaerobic nitric oxide reductase transcription regulator
MLELNRARLGLRSLRLSTAAEAALRRYPWPGNVRELEHVISRAALKTVSRGANRNDIVTLEAELLDLDGLEPAPAGAAAPLPIAEPGAFASSAATLREAVDQCQRHCIEQALATQGGNWAQAARQLGVDASNLHKLARRLGIMADDRPQRMAG